MHNEGSRWRRYEFVRRRYRVDLGPQYDTYADRILFAEALAALPSAEEDLIAIYRALGVSSTPEALRKIKELNRGL